MASDAVAPPSSSQQKQQQEIKRHRSIFELPVDFFEACRILPSPTSSPSLPATLVEPFRSSLSLNDVVDEDQFSMQRWSCNTCKAEFDSLLDQRSHFKSDIHRFNIKLTIAGKDTIKEEDLDETMSDSLCKDYDISSISGSEDEDDKNIVRDFPRGLGRSEKSKLFIQLQTGERVSLLKCLLLNDSESILYDGEKFFNKDDGENYLTEKEVTEKLTHVIHEPRDNTNFRVVLLLRGGHFAACVFDGNSVVAHKTFHRYVVRAKAGKQQSSKDAGGKTIHSAGAALRRYNELALKKDIQELLAAWKPYLASSSSIFIYPSSNRQLFLDGDKPYLISQHHVLRNIPLTVRRPTLKEARRIYNILTQISYNVDDEIIPIVKDEMSFNASVKRNESLDSGKANLKEDVKGKEATNHCSEVKILESDNVRASSESESNSVPIGTSTPLHDAAKSGNAQKVVELLEQDSDPCTIDERGRTPYMLATEKEVRNAFRRFMASNLDKWDWLAAKVPSALTKEMEESQAAKQAEKDAKRKARAKELKKLRRAKEKKAQAEAEAAQSQTTSVNRGAMPLSSVKGKSQSSGLTKEEELKRAQEAEREKRAAAAERRLGAMAASRAECTESGAATSSSQSKTSDTLCSCCHSSLVGKVPFHRTKMILFKQWRLNWYWVVMRPENPDPMLEDQEDARKDEAEGRRGSKARKGLKEEAAEIGSNREDQGI